MIKEHWGGALILSQATRVDPVFSQASIYEKDRGWELVQRRWSDAKKESWTKEDTWHPEAETRGCYLCSLPGFQKAWPYGCYGSAWWDWFWTSMLRNCECKDCVLLFQAPNYTMFGYSRKPMIFFPLYPPPWFLHFPRTSLALPHLWAVLVFLQLCILPFHLFSTHDTNINPLSFLSKMFPGSHKQPQLPFLGSTKVIRICTTGLGSENEKFYLWVSKWKTSQIRTLGFKFCHWNFIDVP